MAGKNTAVFGIYQNQAAVERAVESLKDGGFRNTDISVLFPENTGTKDFAAAKGTRPPKVRPREPAAARLSAVRSGGSRVLERWPSQGWGRSSPLGPSWRR